MTSNQRLKTLAIIEAAVFKLPEYLLLIQVIVNHIKYINSADY